MKKTITYMYFLPIYFGILINYSTASAQSGSDMNAQPVIDIQQEWPVIENIDRQFSKYILEGDSIALAALYAKDGKLGCSSGPEILSALGAWIRNSIKNDSRHITFITKTLNSDGELLIETGIAETRNDNGELKYTGKYLVVWKKENGTWKLYRDIGL